MKTEPALRVMLVDDHAVVRMGFRLLVEESDCMTVCAEASSGEVACKIYPEVKPDVLVMDLSMSGMGGMEAVSRIVAHDSSARILVLSAHEDTMHPKRAMNAGARGYLSKRCAAEELIKAIRRVAHHEIYVDSQLATALVEESVFGSGNPVEVLSEREFEVFMHLARGLTVPGIAEILFLSPRTVGTHLYNIKQKLNAKNQAELTLIALRNQLLSS